VRGENDEAQSRPRAVGLRLDFSSVPVSGYPLVVPVGAGDVAALASTTFAAFFASRLVAALFCAMTERSPSNAASEGSCFASAASVPETAWNVPWSYSRTPGVLFHASAYCAFT
jgi:hypothetical protein